MITTLLAARLVRADRVRSFHIRSVVPAGWEASEYEGERVVRQHYRDWHRVEGTLVRYSREIASL